jgi:LEA14-like dessication related protein
MQKQFRVNALLALFVLITSITMSSCLTYQEVEFVGMKGVEVEDMSTKEIKVRVSIQVKNPNNYKIKITKSDLDLFLGGKALGKAVIGERIILPKNSNETHTFTISTDLSKLGGMLGVGAMMLGGGSKTFRVKGWVKAKAFGVGKKFPVDFKESLKIPLSGLF